VGWDKKGGFATYDMNGDYRGRLGGSDVVCQGCEGDEGDGCGEQLHGGWLGVGRRYEEFVPIDE
jgi:hypothetical protein